MIKEFIFLYMLVFSKNFKHMKKMHEGFCLYENPVFIEAKKKTFGLSAIFRQFQPDLRLLQ